MNLSQSTSPAWQPNVSRIVPTVFVVDHDIAIRESLELLIRASGWQPETFASAYDFLSRPRSASPSCLICDVAMPDLNGLELQQLVADRVEMPIIFVAANVNVRMAVRAVQAGAVEVLMKPCDGGELVNVIGKAIERSKAALLEVAKFRMLQDRYDLLTPREREVMALVVAGRMNKQIAADLHISLITVKAHRRKVMEKTKAESLAELVRIAAELRIAPAEHGRRAPWSRP
jgi:FixJ family two-component response regulator